MQVAQSTAPNAQNKPEESRKEKIIRQNAKRVFGEQFKKGFLKKEATVDETEQFAELCVKLGIIPLDITIHHRPYGLDLRPYAKLHYIDTKQKKQLSVDINWSWGFLKPKDVISALKEMK